MGRITFPRKQKDIQTLTGDKHHAITVSIATVLMKLITFSIPFSSFQSSPITNSRRRRSLS
ncbi:hypothetical protein L208DRAFT_1390444 [Tricholoma matsutake]|nr:hypothetical protein L208DRAFT_1390444 [Tricholoma matsutake 945]